MKTRLKLLIKEIPSVPVYFYLLLLAISSTSAFILLLSMVS